MTNPRWKRILITGASGRLGSQLRTGLTGTAEVLRLTDIRDLGDPRSGEETITADLADSAAVRSLMDGVDLVLHFGAVMVRQPWDSVLQANIIGSYNIFEAARAAGVKRIVYASSSHAVGMYRCDQVLDGSAPPRPDTPYGLSKAFGENLARMYFDKYGIEVACLRIGSCFEKPTNERMLATWLSHADLIRLVRACIEAPVLGYTIVYGQSNNRRSYWDNQKASFLGYCPQDSADNYTEAVLAEAPPPAEIHPADRLQGGRFVLYPEDAQ